MEKCGFYKGLITKVESFVTATKKDGKTISKSIAKHKKSVLERNFDKFVESIDLLYENERITNDVYEKEYSVYKDKFERSIAELERLTDESIVEEESDDELKRILAQQTELLSRMYDNRSSVGLPRISIKPFEGSYSEWLEFRDLFSKTITSRNELSDAERLYYLKANIRGEAARLIKNLSATNENFEIAWDMLEKRYSDKKVIVNELIRKFNISKRVTDPRTGLQEFSIHFDELLNSLDSLGDYGKSRDPWIINRALSFLDNETINMWARESVNLENPTCDDFKTFLSKRFREIDIVKGANLSNPRFKVLATTKLVCAICDGDHSTVKCYRMLKKSVDDRVKLLSEKRLCFNCLKKGHVVSKCPGKGFCSRCDGKHHTIIHDESKRKITGMKTKLVATHPVTECEPIETSVVNRCVQDDGQVLLPTVELLIKCIDGRLVSCRALLDTGSQVNLISESLFEQIGVRRSQARRLLRGVSSDHSEETRGKSLITLVSKQNLYRERTLEVLILRRLTGEFPDRDMKLTHLRHIQKYPLADSEFYRSRGIDLLIGVDGYCQFTCAGKQFIRDDGLWMINSIFGWLLCGGSGHIDPNEVSVVNTTIVENIDHQLKQFWAVNESTDSGQEIMPSPNIDRNSDGRYIVRLPFLRSPPQLGDSFRMARSQFWSLEKRFDRDAEFKRLYVEFMGQYENLDHMRLLSENDLNSQKPHFYVPHHGIFQKRGDMKKLRVVFNASAKTSNGRSLNDELNCGPNLQSLIVDVLVRFREYKYAFMGDVKKMYRQIRLHSDDADFMRILWRENRDEGLKHFALQTVTYGTNCAPFDALRVMHQLVNDEGNKYPMAMRIVKDQRYMDDLFGGHNDLAQAILARNELINLMKAGGFELGKWVANEPKLLYGLDAKDCLISGSEKFFSLDENVRTLGVIWRPREDVFTFDIRLPSQHAFTKRSFLSEFSRIFDPLGFLAPIIVTMKLMMQQIWKSGLGWDDELPGPIWREWLDIRNNLSVLTEVKVKRWIGEHERLELRGYSDASQKAYGAVIYCVAFDRAGGHRVSLLAAKSRIAPIKELTIPRLELCGALLLSELMHQYSKFFDQRELTIRCWSDSKIVIGWINRQNSRMDVFVRNRVSKIVAKYSGEYWSYIASECNPADLITRGMSPRKLCASQLWWCGPSEIHASDDSDELRYDEYPEVEHESSIAVGCLQSETAREQLVDVDWIEKYSTLSKLKRVASFVFRFAYRYHAADKPGTLTISLSELNDTFMRIIRLTQRRYLLDDYNRCLNGKAVLKSSSLYCLNPFLDHKNIIRVGSRLSNIDLSEMQKHPVVLPKCHLSSLIVREVHQINLHCGVNQTVSIIRRSFWVSRLISLVKKEINRCLKCRRYRGETFRTMMSPIPAFRVSQAKAFYRSGVDYAGPFRIRAFRHRGNLTTDAYVAIFVCLATRAVHIELVFGLDRDSFLAAFERFIARRGNCAEIWSDNGRNFLASSKLLKKFMDLVATETWTDAVSTMLSSRNVSWNFIPPYAPHFGGIWESAVKVMKNHLKKAVGERIMTVEEFNTILCQIESVMNSRPIATKCDDPFDFDVITPSHFIFGDPVCPLIDVGQFEPLSSLRVRLKMIADATKVFWRGWSRDFMQSMMTRRKWLHSGQHPTVGELVLIRRVNSVPGCWRMARITKLLPGADAEVRVVEIFDGRSNRIEAVRNLVPIDLKPTSPSTGQDVQTV